MLKVKNISKKINNNNILENIKFDLIDGDVLGIAGSNGAGKSTLISILSNINKPTKGEVIYQSNDQNQNVNPKNYIGYVPQDIAVYEQLTVKDNFLLFSHKNISTEKALERASVVAENLCLKNDFNKKVSKLSGGTKRRVNLGVALMSDPKFIFMDEPVVGVDYTIKKDIQRLILDMSKEGKIIVIVSHLVEFLSSTCNKLLILNNGKQEYFGDFKDGMDKL